MTPMLGNWLSPVHTARGAKFAGETRRNWADLFRVGSATLTGVSPNVILDFGYQGVDLRVLEHGGAEVRLAKNGQRILVGRS